MRILKYHQRIGNEKKITNIHITIFDLSDWIKLNFPKHSTLFSKNLQGKVLISIQLLV